MSLLSRYVIGILLWGCPVCCSVFSSIPGFCPLDARDTSTLTTVVKTKKVLRHCPTSLVYGVDGSTENHSP